MTEARICGVLDSGGGIRTRVSPAWVVHVVPLDPALSRKSAIFEMPGYARFGPKSGGPAPFVWQMFDAVGSGESPLLRRSPGLNVHAAFGRTTLSLADPGLVRAVRRRAQLAP
jgi:hypothetical protein